MKANRNKHLFDFSKWEKLIRNTVFVFFGVILFLFILLKISSLFYETDVWKETLNMEISGKIINKFRKDRYIYIVVNDSKTRKDEYISLSWFSVDFEEIVKTGDSIYSKSGVNKITIYRGDSVFVVKKVEK